MRVLLVARHGAVLARTKAIGQLKTLIVNAPDALHEQPRGGSTDQQLDPLRPAAHPAQPQRRAPRTVRAIRAVARRALLLEAEAAEHESDLEEVRRPPTGSPTAASAAPPADFD